MGATLSGLGRSLAGCVVDAVPQRAIAAGLEVVRDGCRFDMYQTVVGPSDALCSVGSTSTAWMDNTFTSEYADG